jgi:transcriptional regulator GlxA family with amidase domain
MHRATTPETERHFTVEEVAKQWSVSRDTVRRLFIDEPGVTVLGRPCTKYRRAYRTLRIPKSIMTRVYARLMSRAA